MDEYADMRDMARLSKDAFSDITSLEQINRKHPRFEKGYPGAGSPEWWALRLRYEGLLMAEIRKSRSGSLKTTPIDPARATAAKWAALGNEQADVDYQRDGKSREWWLAHWNSSALSGHREDYL